MQLEDLMVWNVESINFEKGIYDYLSNLNFEYIYIPIQAYKRSGNKLIQSVLVTNDPILIRNKFKLIPDIVLDNAFRVVNKLLPFKEKLVIWVQSESISTNIATKITICNRIQIILT